jgi:hypothetical protein
MIMVKCLEFKVIKIIVMEEIVQEAIVIKIMLLEFVIIMEPIITIITIVYQWASQYQINQLYLII